MENINFLPVLAVLIGLASISLFFYFNYDLIQPTVSFFFVMTFSLFLGVFNINKWNLYVGPDTSLIVIGGMLSFAMGAGFVHFYFYNRAATTVVRSKNKIEKIRFGIYKVPYLIVVICSFITLILSLMSVKELYELSLQLGNQSGLANMIKTLRYPLERGEISFSRWVSYRNLVAMIFATSFLFVFMNNLIMRSRLLLRDCVYLLPIVATIPFFIMSTGRRSIVHFVICGLVMAIILYQRKNGTSHKAKLKIVKMIGVTGIFSIALYFILGFLTGKVSIGGRSPLTIISHYGGLSVPALEQYVTSVHVENQYFLQNTMMGIYGNLNSLGFHFEPGKPFLPFVEFQGTEHITTNVYTVFYRLLADYSFPGLLIIMFVFGVILTYFYDDLKHSNSSCKLVIYSYYGYIPFFLFIDDQFMGLFTSRTVYFCILLSGLIYLLDCKYFQLCGNSEEDIVSNNDEST